MPDDFLWEAGLALAMFFLSFGTAIFQGDSVSFVIKAMPMVLHATKDKLHVRAESPLELGCFLLHLAFECWRNAFGVP